VSAPKQPLTSELPPLVREWAADAPEPVQAELERGLGLLVGGAILKQWARLDPPKKSRLRFCQCACFYDLAHPGVFFDKGVWASVVAEGLKDIESSLVLGETYMREDLPAVPTLVQYIKEERRNPSAMLWHMLPREND
jgi:hypothetical protein